MRKYIVLLAAVVMQSALGSNYAWSVFVPSLAANYGLSVTQSQLIFSTVPINFTIFILVGGRLLDRYGPRLPALLGSLIYCGGYLLAGYSRATFVQLLLYYGICVGMGTSLAYLSPISTSVKWFPRHKGIVTGVAVFGFGAGTMIVAAAAERLLKSGWDVLHIFRAMGLTFFIILIPCVLLLKSPPADAAARRRTPPWRKYLADRRFWGLFAGMYPALAVGFMVIGNLKPIGISWGLSAALAGAGVSLLALFNGLGRLSWGLLCDRFGGRRVIMLQQGANILLLGGAWLAPKGGALFILFAALAGFNYGGALVIYAAEVARIWGPECMGVIYSTLFVTNGLGATAAPIAGKFFDRTGSYSPAFLLFGLVSLVALGLVGSIYRPRAGRGS